MSSSSPSGAVDATSSTRQLWYGRMPHARGLHSSAFQLNLSRF
jgi:hypothetical protein